MTTNSKRVNILQFPDKIEGGYLLCKDCDSMTFEVYFEKYRTSEKVCGVPTMVCTHCGTSNLIPGLESDD